MKTVDAEFICGLGDIPYPKISRILRGKKPFSAPLKPRQISKLWLMFNCKVLVRNLIPPSTCVCVCSKPPKTVEQKKKLEKNCENVAKVAGDMQTKKRA